MTLPNTHTHSVLTIDNWYHVPPTIVAHTVFSRGNMTFVTSHILPPHIIHKPHLGVVLSVAPNSP